MANIKKIEHENGLYGKCKYCGQEVMVSQDEELELLTQEELDGIAWRFCGCARAGNAMRREEKQITLSEYIKAIVREAAEKGIVEDWEMVELEEMLIACTNAVSNGVVDVVTVTSANLAVKVKASKKGVQVKRVIKDESGFEN